MWVRSRQYTGRIVTVTNDNSFEQHVYNLTRRFPYLWEEMQIPISYKRNKQRAESILLEAGSRWTVKIDEGATWRGRYLMKQSDLHPHVYWRLTDNWLEMSPRFIAQEHGIREFKDRISRDILRGFDEASIGIASGTYDIVGLPPLRIESQPYLGFNAGSTRFQPHP